MYESFVLGVPVCASNVVALPEQMGDAGVLFDPLSVADMAEKICQVLSDTELRQSLVERGRKRIVQLSSANYAGKLQNLVMDVIERSRVRNAKDSKGGTDGCDM
jgi:glycosyltransferase involved in cell wall biosynthesis